MWESFGTAFIDIIAAQDAIRDLPGASRLWVIVAASFVDLLRAGQCPVSFSLVSWRTRRGLRAEH